MFGVVLGVDQTLCFMPALHACGLITAPQLKSYAAYANKVLFVRMAAVSQLTAYLVTM